MSQGKRSFLGPSDVAIGATVVAGANHRIADGMNPFLDIPSDAALVALMPYRPGRLPPIVDDLDI
jgi:hypothetical protein